MKTLTALAALLAPRLALACPVCAGRESSGSGTWLLVGAMILAPYAVAAVVVPIVRRVSKDQEGA